MDKKHLFEKGNKRCIIVHQNSIPHLPKPSCCDKNNQCQNQLRRQACVYHWKETLAIYREKGIDKAMEYLDNARIEMNGWFK